MPTSAISPFLPFAAHHAAPLACLFTATAWGRFWTSSATGARGA